jgi:hypothetical protein
VPLPVFPEIRVPLETAQQEEFKDLFVIFYFIRVQGEHLIGINWKGNPFNRAVSSPDLSSSPLIKKRL